jgi:Glyoxalase/Bleomycin resistance protein/Dioxygenase superfamily
MTRTKRANVSLLGHCGERADTSYGAFAPVVADIGFIQESEARVNVIHQRLRDDGFEVAPPPKLHGSWTFYFRAPGGFTIEVLS